ncbi:carotenoid oxygenase family protein [Flindersiella endophytica]
MTSAYLQGHLAPVADEIDAVDLPVTGVLPDELNGRYFRNGPNPLPGQDPGHWFAGHGMLHGVRLRAGRAEWYRNRWVRTRRLEGAEHFTGAGVDRTAVTANTHVIHHNDKILALVENGFPYEVTPELDTVGPCDFHGRLTTAMTAHPKQDPATGELHFFGYGFRPPYLTYHRLSASGELVESREIAVPGPTMMHDFAITANHIVWLDLPLVFDVSLVGKGMPVGWDDTYGARIGVMPRDGSGKVAWFDVDPCYVFHVGNARDDAAGRVVLEAARYTPGAFNAIWASIGGTANPAAAAAELGGAHLHRWVFDPSTGVVKEEQLDDRDVEFPTINDGLTGLPSRFLFTVSENAVVKYDTTVGSATTYDLRADQAPGEAVFVPAAGSQAEDTGWLLSIVTSRTADESELLVLDAHDLARVASVRLPRRVPAGFHGSWIADEDPT